MNPKTANNKRQIESLIEMTLIYRPPRKKQNKIQSKIVTSKKTKRIIL